ncbi:MAG: hypothetical protein WA989_07155 [Henriciella sp.]|uniref:hypothetical protein n=1 Tax=Henriciella sp. TaxID=1968823 RepID=UPI003C746686
MDQMGTREDCDCMAKEAEALLGETLFSDFVTLNTSSAESTSEEVTAAKLRYQHLSPAEQGKVATFQKEAIEVCGLRR